LDAVENATRSVGAVVANRGAAEEKLQGTPQREVSQNSSFELSEL
jgi:hypothetical protein